MSNQTYGAFYLRLHTASRKLDQLADEFLGFDRETAAELRVHALRLSELAAKMESQRRLDPLPDGQARVLTFVRGFIAKHGLAPTRQEIADGCGFSSANSAQEHLKRLAAKGVISLSDGARAIRLNKRTAA